MSVKIEVDNVCRGCLCVDRNIVPLKKNVSLFFILLADQFIPKESSYFNMYLCWECIALLRKVAEFQKQLQQSKNVFLQKWDETKKLKCLSRLTKSHKSNYDLTIEYKEKDTMDIKIIETFSINKQIKEEISDASDNDKDFDSSTDNKIDITDDIKSTDTQKKKVTYKRNSIRATLKTTRVVYDEVEIDRSMSEVELKIKELDELRKNKRGFIDMSYRSNVVVKKMLENKKNDLQKNDITSCSECNETLPNRTSMAEHWETHTVKLIKCHYCTFYGNDREDMMGHLQQKHTKIFTCTCNAQFRALRDLFKHNNYYHKRFDCDLCKKRYKSKEAIEKHMRHRHLPAKCDLCQRVYRNPKILKSHYYIYHPELRRVKDEAPYCVECDMKFDNDFLYKRHLRSAVAHCPKREAKVPCPDCGKIFSRKTYMTNHYNLVHVRQSKHYCELCDKYFITGYAIRTHKKFVHEKREKPKDKICEICGRGFFTNRVLINHKRTHTGERPFMCTFCPAAFAQRSAMKTHERTQHRNYINS